MEMPYIEKEQRAAVVSLILGSLGLLLSPFPYLLLEKYSWAVLLLKKAVDFPMLNIAFCSSIFISIFAAVNGVGYLLNISRQVGKKFWTVALVGTVFGLLNLFLAFVVWLAVAE